MRLSGVYLLSVVMALPAPPPAGAAADIPPVTESLTAALFKTASGLVLHYVAQGDPKGPVIVFLHGIGDSWHSWELVLPHIPRTFRAYAVTMRGHGLSDHPATGYTRADFAADVSAFLAGLGLENVCLVGHSLGSFTAQEVATGVEARRIGRLFLVGSGPFGPRDPRILSELRTFFAGMKDPIDAVTSRDFQLSTAFRPLPPVFLETMIAELQKSPARAFNEFGSSLATLRPLDDLKLIKAPTLLVWGDKDALLTRGDQDALLAGIRGSRLVVYTGTGHTPHWEEPERLARDLVEFLER